MAFFLAKLKALYTLSDAMALGARPNEVSTGSHFFRMAEYIPENAFTDDDDMSDSTDE